MDRWIDRYRILTVLLFLLYGPFCRCSTLLRKLFCFPVRQQWNVMFCTLCVVNPFFFFCLFVCFCLYRTSVAGLPRPGWGDLSFVAHPEVSPIFFCFISPFFLSWREGLRADDVGIIMLCETLWDKSVCKNKIPLPFHCTAFILW